VKLSAGDDVETAQSAARLARQAAPESACTSSRPLLTISIGEAEGNTTIFEYTTIVTGMKIFAPGLPNGIYPVLIMPIEPSNPVLQFSANNGVLTLLPETGPPGEPLQPVILPASTGTVFAIYPEGSVPIVCVTPSPSPSPTQSPTPSPTPTGPTPTPSSTPIPSASPTQFPTAMPVPGRVGQPPPAVNAVIGAYSFTDPSTESCQSGQLLCNGTNVPITQVDGSQAAIDIPFNFYGTITFAANIGYMGIYPPVVITCPSDWTVVAGIDGSGSVSVPSSDPFGSGGPCSILYSTLPPGDENNNAYSEELGFEGVLGVPCSNGVCTASARRRRP
jgi:hypothetical protein